MMSPGTYLARRRVAAGMSIDDVAASISTAPRLGEIDRRAWVERLEQDIAAISPDVIHTLSCVVPFDSLVLSQLVDFRSYGPPVEPPRICMTCGCSALDACEPLCSWAGPDVCSACAPLELTEVAA
ncbi:MAG: XRE family transcriptional regulator [Sphingobium sp.]|uniref:helix-turn-helix domain-containing protein n=1 Tax=Sphingobium sp. TaxID=1912891 RepID=UPI0029BDB0B9|nr:XRE family transcriptional regulator [Sphingobium sp.]MDX3908878.1 XRE family transcriptional regulator [Sphingobium sp.]